MLNASYNTPHDSSSLSISSPSLLDLQPGSGTGGGSRTVRCCAVCGDAPAKLHYGVLACFGCKGFFRRAVKEGRNKYICRYDKQCKVDKYERNTCRWCRFRKCLLVGMNPDSVRPDRNESAQRQKTRLTRMNSTVKSVHTSSHFRLTRQDSGRPLNSQQLNEDGNEDESDRPMPQVQKHLLMSITKLDAKCVKECNNQSVESVRNFTLKSLINERLLALDDQSRTYFDSRDNSIHALWRIVFAVDWVNNLCSMAVQGSDSSESITVEDKIAIVQTVFARLVTFRLCVQRILDEETSENCDLNLLRQFDDDCLYNSAVEDIVRPFKKSGISRQELLLLQTILTVDPAIKGIRPAASDLLLEFRNRVQELLIGVMKKAKRVGAVDVNAQFGNYLLLFPTVMAIADRLSSHLRQKFPLGMSNFQPNDPPHFQIIQNLMNPDLTDFLRFPTLNRKIFGTEKESPADKQILTPSSTQYNNAWQSFSSVFTGIQMPPTFAYNAVNTSSPSNFSLMSALSPSSYSSTTNLFPAQPLPEPSPSSTSCHSFIAASLAPPPPLTITAPTPPPTALHPPQFMPFHTPPSDTDNRSLLNSGGIGQQSPLLGHQILCQDDSSRLSNNNNLEVPNSNCNNFSASNASRIIPKLPLQLTKSIEEMLRPTGTLQDDTSFWNKPLAMDWADLKVSTPAFNQEVVAKFFPECATTSGAPGNSTNIFKT